MDIFCYNRRMQTPQKNGLYYLFQGFYLITKPGVKRYVFIPLLINVLIFVGLFFYAQHLFSGVTEWVLGLLPHWLQWLGSILWLLFFVGFFFLMVYTFITLANIIAAPFNSFLAEKIEHHLTGQERKGLSFMELAQRIDTISAKEKIAATGKAGTVYLCHPFIVHAAQNHYGTTPKFMAQPPLLTKNDFNINKTDALLCPVEKAILTGLRM